LEKSLNLFMNDKIIKIDDVEGKVYELDNWKPEQATQVKNHFTERFKELKNTYDELIQDFNWNKIVFESEINFTPVIGKTYYLYETDKRFLSLISPEEWGDKKINYIGAFKQDSRQKWCHLKLDEK
tara:strand:- start:53 stop:430 length:378 start_codon:yes stop_codon:yes gene_type:complete